MTWDLTRDKAERIDPPEAEGPGQTPFVPAGDYEVTLTVGKDKSTARLAVTYPSGVGPEPLPPPTGSSRPHSPEEEGTPSGTR